MAFRSDGAVNWAPSHSTSFNALSFVLQLNKSPGKVFTSSQPPEGIEIVSETFAGLSTVTRSMKKGLHFGHLGAAILAPIERHTTAQEEFCCVTSLQS